MGVPIIDPIELPEFAITPGNPAAGKLLVYSKTDEKIYKLNSAGTETELGAGGGGKTFAFFMS